MFHVDTLWIENYRALQRVWLERCGTVNILMGHNNSGKTSLLEGVCLFARENEDAMPPRTAHGAFHPNEDDEVLEVRAEAGGRHWQGRIWMVNGKMRREVLVDQTPVAPDEWPLVWFVPPMPVTPGAFGAYNREELEIIARVMREFDAGVLHVSNDGVVITENGQMAMESFGEGTRKGVAIICAMIQARGGIVLIDEVEAAFHPRIVPQFGRTLWTLSEQLNVQLFMTTHSLDWIDTVLEIPDAGQKLVGYRMEFDGEHILARRFAHSRLMQMRQMLGLDVR